MTREEAIEIIKRNCIPGRPLREACEMLIPELAESEDERIRKWIIEEFKLHYDFESKSLNPMVEKALAWLERQKDSPMPEDTVIFQKGVEEGRRLEREDVEKERLPIIETYQRSWYTEGYYDGKLKKEPRWIIKTKGICTEYEENPKYGQSLADEQKPPIAGNDFGWIDELKHDLEHPEELDQKVDDVLKQRKGMSLEWCEVELEFRGEKVKVKRQFFRDDKGRKYSTTKQDEDAAWYALRAWCEKKGVSLYDLYPNTEWSKEDEEIFNLTITHLLNYAYPNNPIYCEEAEKCVAWLKSLKNRGNFPQSNTNSPNEWNVNDESAFGDLMWCIEQARKSATVDDMGNVWYAEKWLKNRLKSLRPSWKPSEKQLKALDKIIHGEVLLANQHKGIESLYEQLKKLM